ncbi:MAG TPA: hypothetical protein VGU27_00465, partial [Candidatus Eisenbacteria bacterium]|nr:hypothetical protein [Candidatus Eisenbacteria bacterium]
SPDGRCLAFLGSDSAGVTRVWLRPLDAVTAAPIPGSEGAHRPFWSPDSRFVAFFANGQLRKAPVDGGPAQLVCEASGSDGAWGSKDVILFDGSGGDSIRAVPAGGGVPTGATRLDHAHDFADGWPCFLPDGRHFLYNAQGAGATSRLMVGELGSTRTRSLGPVQTRVLYAAPGYLVTMSADVLVARRFDTRRLAFAGDPIPIVDHVAHGGDFMEAGVSQTGRLVYIGSGRSERGALQWVDRAGRLLSAVGEPLAYRDFALSPDGRRLAYGVEDPQNGTQDLWIRDLARGVSSRFTFEPGNQLWPVWSPDGQRLAYASDASGTFDVVVRPVSGAADQQTLVHRAGPSGPTDWSRDGRTLLFTTYASGGGQLWTVAPQRGATPQPYVATPFSATAGRLSPDGRFVAYESTESGRSEIYVQPFPLANRKVQVSAAGGHDVWWRADGRELFYVDASSAVVAVPVTTQPEFVAGPPRTLFQRTFTGGAIPRNRLEPAGDGQRFLVNVPANTGGPSPLELIVGWPQLLRRR